jgi:hypothetical protein
MKPTIGRIVVYNTTEKEKEAMRTLSSNVQDKLPAIVVAVWSDTCINVKVIVDGSMPDIWRTSINLGEAPGNWSWPVMEK